MGSWGERAQRWRVRLHLPLAIAYLGLARPDTSVLLLSLWLIVPGLGLRAWAAGHLHKELPLTVTGPYARLRHPLYVGTLLIFAGLCVASASLWVLGLVAAFVLLFYVPAMRKEEGERSTTAPDLHALYRAQVPAWWPRLKAARFRQPEARGDRRFTWKQFLVNNEWRAAVGLLALYLLLVAKYRLI